MSKGYNYVGFGLAISSSGKRYWAGVYLKGPDRTGAWTKMVSVVKTNLDRTYLRISLRWSGSDTRLQVLTSGLRYYQVQRRRNGGYWYDYGTTTGDPDGPEVVSQQHLRAPHPGPRQGRQLGRLGRDHDQDLTRPPGARRSRTAAPTAR